MSYALQELQHLLNKNNFQQESEETVNQKLYFGCCDFFLCMKRVLGQPRTQALTFALPPPPPAAERPLSYT